MSMNEFRRLAAKIDQHMQQLAAQSLNEPHAIINRMMGYIPELHTIWVGTSDDQLIALSNEFPHFYRYAFIMEEATEAERNRVSRPYEGMAQCSDQHKEMGTQLLTMAATQSVVIKRLLGTEPKALAYVDEAYGRIAECLKKLAEVKLG